MRTLESPWWACCGPRYWCWGCRAGPPSGGQSPGLEDTTCWTSGCCSRGGDISRHWSGWRGCGSPGAVEHVILGIRTWCLPWEQQKQLWDGEVWVESHSLNETRSSHSRKMLWEGRGIGPIVTRIVPEPGYHGRQTDDRMLDLDSFFYKMFVLTFIK